MPTPELMAPAGNLECARAAIANGADAVYFGLPRFNARMRADNFTVEQLPELVRLLHAHRVRAIAVLNILVFTAELAEAEQELRALEAAGVDAVIVQDLGVAALAQRMGLGLEVHGSTQMTITTPAQARFVAQLGIRRVVLARELALKEIAAFQAAGVETEVFVHGALCVAYSGQCLTSEALGQRSANRGECASACRLPYAMIVDGVRRDLGDRQYLLSPQDLAAVREIPELMRLGVAAFKIEGRLKSPEYVAATTRVYRKAIDAVAVDAKDWYDLEMTFSRGLSTGWLHGNNHQTLVPARFGSKRGPLAGRVREVGRDYVEVEACCAVQAGDGVLFEGCEQGGYVWQVRQRRWYFQQGKIDFRRIQVGASVWKTSDPHLERELRRSFRGPLVRPKQRLDMRVSGRAGEEMVVAAGSCEVRSRMPLQVATKRPLGSDALREQLGRLGDTDYELGDLQNELAGPVILPLSELNRLRRELVGNLAGLPADSVPARPEMPEPAAAAVSVIAPRSTVHGPTEPQLAVLCRSLEQVQASLAARVPLLYVEFEDIRRYAVAVGLAKSAGTPVYLASPRIAKVGEQGYSRTIRQAGADGVLVRNLGALQDFDGARIGDFSLNVANPWTARLLIEAGLQRVTVSYDLNAEQVLDLLRAAPPDWFEIVLHQHLPMFHMEHCVFAAFLSAGTDHTNCGRPCDQHRVKLRDRIGAEHTVRADVGCRNTVYHAKAQSGAVYWREFAAAGARLFRVELLDETAEQTATLIQGYGELLAGRLDGHALANRLRVANQLGVTSGTLTVLG